MNSMQQEPKKQWPAYLGSLVVALGLIVLIAAVHRNSPRTLISFHGLLHASIADGFAEGTRSTFPPENPFFAGEPLCYYWFFHFLAGLLVCAFDMNVFHALEAVIFVAVIGLVFAAVALGRRLFKSAVAGYAIVFLILAGTNPFGFVFAATKIARDGVERLQDDPNFLWGVVHPLFGLIRFNDTGGLYGPMLNFFLNITSRPAALGALLVAVLALHMTLASRRWLFKLFLLLSTALTTALSPVLGLSAVFALTVGMIFTLLYPKMNRSKEPSDVLVGSARLVAVIAVMVFGAVIALPTYYHLVFGPSASHMRVWIMSSSGIRHAMTVCASVSPLLVLAYLGWKKSPAVSRRYLCVLLVAGLVLLGICVVVVLPAWNQSNCFHAAVVLLAVPASAFLLRRDKTGRPSSVSIGRLVGLGVFFLPTTLLLLGSYVQRPDAPVSFSGRQISRTPPDSDLATLYEWVRSETANDAIFVLNPNPPHVRVCGNSSEFPAMTGRAMFTEELRHYLVQPYPQAKLRADLAVKLSAGEPVTGDEFQYLRDLKRPIYLLVFEERNEDTPERLQSEHGQPVFQLSNIAVYRVRTAEQVPI